MHAACGGERQEGSNLGTLGGGAPQTPSGELRPLHPLFMSGSQTCTLTKVNIKERAYFESSLTKCTLVCAEMELLGGRLNCFSYMEGRGGHDLKEAYLERITSFKSRPRSLSSTIAALRPGAPVTEPPGWVVAPVW